MHLPSAYTALVRPLLESASEAWNPHNCQVTGASTKICGSICSHAATLGEQHPPQPWFQLLDGTAFTLASSFHNAPSLSHRIHHQLVCLPFPQVISQATYIRRHDHTAKYAIPKAAIDAYEFAMFPRMVRIWDPSFFMPIQLHSERLLYPPSA